MPLRLETLEPRTLPTTSTIFGLPSAVLETEPNNTIDQAQSLGDLSILHQVRVGGTIGAETIEAGDVDWYRFTLDRPSAVTLATSGNPSAGSFVSVLSLYGETGANPNGLSDYTSYRLIMQADGAAEGGQAHLDRDLAAGTYFAAVSGSGDLYFNPSIADSGYPGSTGAYKLLVAATDLHLSPGDGPVVLATDPAGGTALAYSPFVLRIAFSTALEPDSIQLGSDVELSYTAGTAPGEQSQAVPLASVSFDNVADELDLTPAAPLRPGNYEISLAGNRRAHQTVLTDLANKPLGKSLLYPSGNDVAMTFRITGIKGNPAANAGADDTPATAQNLGDLVGAGLVQIAGAIGDDPTNPIPWDPADVDLYHFQIHGSGRYALTAEVFAGRIDSTLDPALTLFRLDASGQGLDFVASNDGSFNPTVTHDGSAAPLFSDPLLNAGLMQGDYYLAVSSNPNVPMPVFGHLPGTAGVFNPEVTHSGQAGSTIGDYVLNVAVVAMNNPPQVSGVPTVDGIPLNPGTVLPAPPATLSVTFDETVNLAQLARQNGLPELSPIFVESSQGTKFFPQLVADTGDGTGADFLFPNALPNGTYQLHLSGPLGLTDLAGNPLAGNDPSGDYVIPFAVNGPARGTDGNPQLWMDEEPNNDPADAQNLGVLFPAELITGIRIERISPPAGTADTADYYRFQLVQETQISFALNSPSAPAGIRLTLADASGNPIRLAGSSLRDAITLEPGTYILGIIGWSPTTTAKLIYQLSISGGSLEQAPPLSIGPGPAIWINHLTRGPGRLPDATVSTGSSSGEYASTGAGHDLGVIPSSAFLLLATGPLGNPSPLATSPPQTDVYANILARAPDILLTQVVAQLPLLIAAQHSGTQQNGLGSAEYLQWIQTIFQEFTKVSWSQALDFLYGSGQWQERTFIRPVNALPEGKPEKSPPAAVAEPPPSSDDSFEETAVPDWAVAAALVACTSWEPSRRLRSRPVGK
jgi:hypothetical protein